MQVGNGVMCFVCLTVCVFNVKAEDVPKSQAVVDNVSPPGESGTKQLYDNFSKLLSEVRLVGRFTTLGKDDQLVAKEEYTIHSATKMLQGDYWLITARIKYGNVDVTLPMPLEVKWAGDTPVITLTNVTIPGMGTFSSRVLIYNNKYVGTWTHGDVGGHLLGTLKHDQQKEPD